MDNKTLGTVEDVGLADQAGGAILNLRCGGNMTRDEKEMEFYGRKAELKVHVLEVPL